ncbi:CDP-glycerol glycerophosphotransferase family protein [Limosilactobacillus reuteri]|uniref:CDP-glycerol glycerophosphotransferase family protein n=1 Tax=Limosilactobacillus reuteri TaxID=1598 RepID=UPI002362381F|nr:CDP-glycerol glycerophosphotransferase family protein [Limosilactobacillus reuteri]MDD1401139.1 CDP-glycerol glycerophosphotransferase family protein [Limosilactobacillus reuteri]
MNALVKAILFRSVNLFSSQLKIKNKKIIVDNFFGRGFGDNPKYIVEKLLAIDPKLDIVWLVNDSTDNKLFPHNVRLVNYWSLRSAYELATAHVWIDNVKNNYKGVKRKKQFYLQTWHGGIGFKKVEKAAQDNLSEEYLKASKRDSKQTDLMISDSKWVTDNYRENFWYSGEIRQIGLPRNDIFYKKSTKIVEKVKSFYGIDEQSEIILYAPTFRGNMSIEKQLNICSFDEEKLIRAFEYKFNKKFVLIKRLHPNISNFIRINETDTVKDGSRYSDMQELLVASYALITDFSSCAFDFMLKSDKIFLYAKDYKRFLSKERGMLFNPAKDLPFLFADNEVDLLLNVKKFNDEIAQSKQKAFKKSVKLIDDGNSSERVANIIINKIRNK